MRASILIIIGLVVLLVASSINLPANLLPEEKWAIAFGLAYIGFIGVIIYIAGSIILGIFRWANKQ